MDYPIIRAIDVGYGNTKYIRDRVVNSNDIHCDVFPSLAPKTSSQSIATADGLMQRRRTVRVLVNEAEYEVGPDASKAQNGIEAGRVLKDDYCLTDTHRALLYGAIRAMDVPRIDVLVLGLPMSTWNRYRGDLVKAMTGTHRIHSDLEVEVRKCLVVPQPLGGFYSHSLSENTLNRMKDEINLIIDPGFYTLDFLLASGVTPLDARSNAINNGGAAEMLKAVMEQIALDFDTTVANIGSVERIDNSLREGRSVRVFGRDSHRSADEYLFIARRRAIDPVNQMMNHIGSIGDIDNIILVGGGVHIFKELIQEQFPHTIQVARDPIFSNVRGFQMIGEKWAQTNLQ